MRAQTIIRVAWVPLLAGALVVLYAPSTPVFAAAAAVFVGALAVQTWASVRVFRLAQRRGAS